MDARIASLINTIIVGDCVETLRTMPDNCVQCCVTSPPYWGLRDYGHDNQIGLESTPAAYVARIVEVFAEVRRVLRTDGTLWLNLGDTYIGGRSGGIGSSSLTSQRNQIAARAAWAARGGATHRVVDGIKSKDLVGIPWRVAFALQADGWYLRSDIIWAKPNPMPESVRDRPTKAHEYLFLLTKQPRYFYDADAINESATTRDNRRPQQVDSRGDGYARGGGERRRTDATIPNKRSVWTVATKGYTGAHFAVMPEALVEPCILAGTSAHGACVTCGAPWIRVVERPGEPPETKTTGWRPTCDHATIRRPCIVLDPFMGAGTVAVVAHRFDRNWIGCELSEEYAALARKRLRPLTSQRRLFVDGAST